LLYVDFSIWKKNQLERLLDYLVEIVESGHEQNRIMYCYNYILTICLSCEHLKRIGKLFSQFKQLANQKINDLLTLGDKILDNLEDDHIEKFFMDRDFKNRTVLKIITDNDFQILLSSEKINILIQEIWVGKKTYACDGKLTDFSLLTYMAKSKIRKLPG
jgi:hypothetical protein